MIANAQADDLPKMLDCDVAIVGSGAAGITLALALGRRGIDVLLLEAGGAQPDEISQDHYRSASVSPSTHHLGHEFRRRAFGGTTALWGGRCIPLDPIDFEVRDWIPHSGWPFAHVELAAYVPAATDICEAGPADYTAAAALPGSPEALAEGVASPDLILDHVERFSLPTNFGARYAADLKALPSVRVLLNAPVIDLLTTADGNQAVGVDIALPTGTRRITARRVILAAGGLESTRLLLAARSTRACGLGNERDLVGRFYQTHLEGNIGTLTLPPGARIGYERSPEGVYCRRYLWLSPEAQRRDALAQLVLRPHYPRLVDPAHRNPILSAMYFAKSTLIPEYARILTGPTGSVPERFNWGVGAAHLRNIALGTPTLAAFVAEWLRYRTFAKRKLPSVVLSHREGIYPVNVNAEQVPNRDSRVLLSDSPDAHGIPRLSVDWQLAEIDRMLLKRGLQKIRTALATSPSARLDLDDATLDDAVAQVTPISHHMGTARMGLSPDSAVCDVNGELFGTRGLYVCGAATFPTSGFANPTLTIVALALRMADHLARA